MLSAVSTERAQLQHHQLTSAGCPLCTALPPSAAVQDVTLYLNNTGLMWELAPKYDAMLVFAEHRYYGARVMPWVAWGVRC